MIYCRSASTARLSGVPSLESGGAEPGDPWASGGVPGGAGGGAPRCRGPGGGQGRGDTTLRCNTLSTSHSGIYHSYTL